jgi:hypothetical protein
MVIPTTPRPNTATATGTPPIPAESRGRQRAIHQAAAPARKESRQVCRMKCVGACSAQDTLSKAAYRDAPLINRIIPVE